MDTGFSIELAAISKRYNAQWVFKNLSYDFHFGQVHAILGYNGSGKSTLLRILSSMESPTAGERIYIRHGKQVKLEDIHSLMSFSAPYMSLPGYLTIREIIEFHGNFKKMTLGIDHILEELNLSSDRGKRFEKLSSGQKQKVKLALAIFNTDPLLLLDEPGTNLDESNYGWFKRKIEEVRSSKLICIATNENRDASLCNMKLNLSLD